MERYSLFTTSAKPYTCGFAHHSSSCFGQNNNAVPNDYGNNKKADSCKVLKFNGDPEEFSWWKTNFYSYVMGLDEELWDILEDGVGDLVLDEEGAAIDRKKHTPAQKKLYKKHHTIEDHLLLLYLKQNT